MSAQSTVRWQQAEVVETTEIADGVRRIVVRPEHPRPAAPGTHLDVELEDAGRTLRRSYSVVRSENDGRHWTISVQLAPASRGGSRTMHRLTKETQLRVSDPVQNFPLGVGAS